MKYTVQNREFKNKEEIKKYIRKMADNYRDKTLLSEEDRDFMIEIIKLHDEAEDKIGCGIKDIWIQKNPPYNTRGFWFVRKDDTVSDFSWIKCIDKPKDHQKRDFYAACRTAVKPQIRSFRDKAFYKTDKITCPLSGEILTKYNCHVDHIYPDTFQNLVKNFIEEYNLDIHSVKIEPTKDGEIETKFKHRDIEELFCNYHLAHAKLRIISKTENLKLSKKGIIKHGVTDNTK